MKFHHRELLDELGIELVKYPIGIRNMIKHLEKKIAEYEAAVAALPEGTPAPLDTLLRLETQSAVIGDEMIDFEERDYEEETPNPINMILTNDDLIRAQAVGLNETATLEEVAAKEADKKAADDAAAEQAAQAAKDALVARAKAVNLPETATEEEIAAAEAAAVKPADPIHQDPAPVKTSSGHSFLGIDF